MGGRGDAEVEIFHHRAVRRLQFSRGADSPRGREPAELTVTWSISHGPYQGERSVGVSRMVVAMAVGY